MSDNSQKEILLREMGGRVKLAREAMKLTQEQFADKYGYVRSTLAKLEAGSRDFKSTEILMLAKQLGVSCDYLLGGIESKTLEIDGIVKAIGLSSKAVETLMYWVDMKNNPRSNIDRSTVKAREDILSFLIVEEETPINGKGDTVCLLSYLYSRLFVNLFTPLLRSNEMVMVCGTIDSEIRLENVPLLYEDNDEVLHPVLLTQDKLNKIYDSDIIEGLAKLRKIADAEKTKPNRRI